jgi:tripartite-type tricarboxylate transporter receptor subunit TctC
MKTIANLRAFWVVVVSACFAAPQTQAQEVDFGGDAITVIVGYGAGGSYDTYGRLIGRFLGRHLPGNPTVIVDNMTGAGSLRAANYIYNVAPKDGTVLGIIGQTIPVDQLLFEDAQQQFDSTKFNWIGRMAAGVESIIGWHTVPVSSIEEAKTREMVIAAAGPSSGSAIFPVVLNNLIGTQFKVLRGYSGTNEMIAAMERGEVDGAGAVNITTLTSAFEPFMREGKIRLLTQVSISRHPAFADIPTFVELGATEDQQAILRLFASSGEIGRALLAPPQTAPARVAALRAAFIRMMSDPELLAIAEQTRIDISPLEGNELQAIVAEIAHTPGAIVEAAKAAKEQ